MIYNGNEPEYPKLANTHWKQRDKHRKQQACSISFFSLFVMFDAFQNVENQPSGKCNTKSSKQTLRNERNVHQTRIGNNQPLLTVIVPIFTVICRYLSPFSVEPTHAIIYNGCEPEYPHVANQQLETK